MVSSIGKHDLTPRELEVLKLLVDGKSNRDIADSLSITVATVESFITSIYRKIGVKNRLAALRFCMMNASLLGARELRLKLSQA